MSHGIIAVFFNRYRDINFSFDRVMDFNFYTGITLKLSLIMILHKTSILIGRCIITSYLV